MRVDVAPRAQADHRVVPDLVDQQGIGGCRALLDDDALVDLDTRTWVASIPAVTAPTDLSIRSSDGTRESVVVITVLPLVELPSGGG
ncbi:MAG: hypothetical protein H0W72_03120 [Planctomycetes bacterium]|nr:hypothetical protein [Planctomycetota bacterium]